MKTILFILFGIVIFVLLLFAFCAFRLSSYISKNEDDN